MTTVCLHVKSTALNPGLSLMSVTLLGPRWEGDRLHLERASELGLEHSDLVGWSDFYGGGPCKVQVACAAKGRESGYLIWGGTLGLRVVPGELQEVDRQLGDVLEARAVLWVDLEDVGVLPAAVRRVVEVSGEAAARVAGSDQVGGFQEAVAAG